MREIEQESRLNWGRGAAHIWVGPKTLYTQHILPVPNGMSWRINTVYPPSRIIFSTRVEALRGL